MSRVLITFPGRYGDIGWMLPTARLLAEHYGDPVDLCIAGEFVSMVPLLQQQSYLASVAADPDWSVSHGWHWPKLDTEGGRWEMVHELGYYRWPELPLPFETYERVASGWLPKLDLSRPWITVNGPGIPAEIAVGFTEAWFELKLGLLMAVERQIDQPMVQLTPFGSRWTKEVPPGTVSVQPCAWKDAARVIRNSDLFFGDCAALHVLAVALGKRAVIMEPMTARLNPIFWPCGQDGPQVTLVRGTDGQSTFDARHCADTLKEALAHAR